MRKLTILVRYLMAFLIILLFSNALFAQFEKYFVAAKWEYYSVKNKNVSVLMPRLPILIDKSNSCEGESIQDYAAYNDGIVFVLRITSKTQVPSGCSRRGEFDESNFNERVKSLKTEINDESDSGTNISKDSVIKLAGSKGIVKAIKLINDYDNKRWFELSVYGADEKNKNVQKFLDSLKTESTGIAIGNGAEQVFGDDATESIVPVKSAVTAETPNGNVEKTTETPQLLIKTDDATTRGVTIIMKERAGYTDAARKSEVRGRVILRVAFLANGAIGDITVLSGLPSGLTEEAIKAARKIVFIPAQGNGKRVSVSKPVEYGFAIY